MDDPPSPGGSPTAATSEETPNASTSPAADVPTPENGKVAQEPANEPENGQETADEPAVEPAVTSEAPMDTVVPSSSSPKSETATPAEEPPSPATDVPSPPKETPGESQKEDSTTEVSAASKEASPAVESVKTVPDATEPEKPASEPPKPVPEQIALPPPPPPTTTTTTRVLTAATADLTAVETLPPPDANEDAVPPRARPPKPPVESFVTPSVSAAPSVATTQPQPVVRLHPNPKQHPALPRPPRAAIIHLLPPRGPSDGPRTILMPRRNHTIFGRGPLQPRMRQPLIRHTRPHKGPPVINILPSKVIAVKQPLRHIKPDATGSRPITRAPTGRGGARKTALATANSRPSSSTASVTSEDEPVKKKAKAAPPNRAAATAPVAEARQASATPQPPVSVTPAPPPPSASAEPPLPSSSVQSSLEDTTTARQRDAITYLEEVKRRFDSGTYSLFLEIMKGFKNKSTDTINTIRQVCYLFSSDISLLRGFNTFLPMGFDVQVLSKKITIQDPNGNVYIIDVTDRSIFYQADASYLKQAALLNRTPASHGYPPTFQTPTMAFENAVIFLQVLKGKLTRERYQEFLKIIENCDRNRLHSDPVNSRRVAQRVAEIFEGDEDLLYGFSSYLPDMYPWLMTEYRRRQRMEKEGPEAEEMMDVEPISAEELETHMLDTNEVAYKPFESRPVQNLLQVIKTTIPHDLVFFNKCRKAFGNDVVFTNFMKIVRLYSHSCVRRDELLGYSLPFFRGLPDLFKEFARILGHPADRIDSRDLAAKGEFGVPPCLKTEVDFTALKLCGRSYRALPKLYRNPRCSGRTALCKSVLNDKWALYPSWQSEETTRVSVKKSQFEEFLHRTEDERFEIDILLHVNAEAVAALERIRNLSRNNPAFEINDKFECSSKTFMLRAMRRVYGENANRVLEALRKNPYVVAGTVLDRLRMKQREWKSLESSFKVIWEDQARKYHQKMHDARMAKQKRRENKVLKGSTILAALQRRFKLRRYLELKDSIRKKDARVYLTFDIIRWECVYDVIDLLCRYLKNQTHLDHNDQIQARRFFIEWIPAILDIQPMIRTATNGGKNNSLTLSRRNGQRILQPRRFYCSGTVVHFFYLLHTVLVRLSRLWRRSDEIYKEEQFELDELTRQHQIFASLKNNVPIGRKRDETPHLMLGNLVQRSEADEKKRRRLRDRYVCAIADLGAVMDGKMPTATFEIALKAMFPEEDIFPVKNIDRYFTMMTKLAVNLANDRPMNLVIKKLWNSSSIPENVSNAQIIHEEYFNMTYRILGQRNIYVIEMYDSAQSFAAIQMIRFRYPHYRHTRSLYDKEWHIFRRINSEGVNIAKITEKTRCIVKPVFLMRNLRRGMLRAGLYPPNVFPRRKATKRVDSEEKDAEKEENSEANSGDDSEDEKRSGSKSNKKTTAEKVGNGTASAVEADGDEIPPFLREFLDPKELQRAMDEEEGGYESSQSDVSIIDIPAPREFTDEEIAAREALQRPTAPRTRSDPATELRATQQRLETCDPEAIIDLVDETNALQAAVLRIAARKGYIKPAKSYPMRFERPDSGESEGEEEDETRDSLDFELTEESDGEFEEVEESDTDREIDVEGAVDDDDEADADSLAESDDAEQDGDDELSDAGDSDDDTKAQSHVVPISAAFSSSTEEDDDDEDEEEEESDDDEDGEAERAEVKPGVPPIDEEDEEEGEEESEKEDEDMESDEEKSPEPKEPSHEQPITSAVKVEDDQQVVQTPSISLSRSSRSHSSISASRSRSRSRSRSPSPPPKPLVKEPPPKRRIARPTRYSEEPPAQLPVRKPGPGRRRKTEQVTSESSTAESTSAAASSSSVSTLVAPPPAPSKPPASAKDRSMSPTEVRRRINKFNEIQTLKLLRQETRRNINTGLSDTDHDYDDEEVVRNGPSHLAGNDEDCKWWAKKLKLLPPAKRKRTAALEAAAEQLRAASHPPLPRGAKAGTPARRGRPPLNRPRAPSKAKDLSSDDDLEIPRGRNSFSSDEELEIPRGRNSSSSDDSDSSSSSSGSSTSSSDRPTRSRRTPPPVVRHSTGVPIKPAGSGPMLPVPAGTLVSLKRSEPPKVPEPPPPPPPPAEPEASVAEEKDEPKEAAQENEATSSGATATDTAVASAPGVEESEASSRGRSSSKISEFSHPESSVERQTEHESDKESKRDSDSSAKPERESESEPMDTDTTVHAEAEAEGEKEEKQEESSTEKEETPDSEMPPDAKTEEEEPTAPLESMETDEPPVSKSPKEPTPEQPSLQTVAAEQPQREPTKAGKRVYWISPAWAHVSGLECARRSVVLPNTQTPDVLYRLGSKVDVVKMRQQGQRKKLLFDKWLIRRQSVYSEKEAKRRERRRQKEAETAAALINRRRSRRLTVDGPVSTTGGVGIQLQSGERFRNTSDSSDSNSEAADFALVHLHSAREENRRIVQRRRQREAEHAAAAEEEEEEEQDAGSENTAPPNPNTNINVNANASNHSSLAPQDASV